MKKRHADLQSDAEAETVVPSVDLTEYDLAHRVPVQLAAKPGAAPLSVALPKHLVDEARTKASHAGIPFQDFIQQAIERAVSD